MIGKHRRKLLYLIPILLILGILFFIPYQKAVVFYYERSTDLIAYLPVKTGDTFQIIFTHSIHLTDVVEKYRVTKEEKIEQYEIVYEQLGIGMPANAEQGQTFVYEDGKYHIKDLKNLFTTMNIRNGKTVSKHRLIWGENNQHMVWFNDYFIPGEWYTVKIETLSLWQLMRGVKIHD